jgi:hypothetical protein
VVFTAGRKRRLHAFPSLISKLACAARSGVASNGHAESSRRGVQRNYSIGRGLGGREAPGGASFSGLRRLGSKLRVGSQKFSLNGNKFTSTGGSFSLARYAGHSDVLRGFS